MTGRPGLNKVPFFVSPRKGVPEIFPLWFTVVSLMLSYNFLRKCKASQLHPPMWGDPSSLRKAYKKVYP